MDNYEGKPNTNHHMLVLHASIHNNVIPEDEHALALTQSTYDHAVASPLFNGDSEELHAGHAPWCHSGNTECSASVLSSSYVMSET